MNILNAHCDLSEMNSMKVHEERHKLGVLVTSHLRLPHGAHVLLLPGGEPIHLDEVLSNLLVVQFLCKVPAITVRGAVLTGRVVHVGKHLIVPVQVAHPLSLLQAITDAVVPTAGIVHAICTLKGWEDKVQTNIVLSFCTLYAAAVQARRKRQFIMFELQSTHLHRDSVLWAHKQTIDFVIQKGVYLLLTFQNIILQARIQYNANLLLKHTRQFDRLALPHQVHRRLNPVSRVALHPHRQNSVFQQIICGGKDFHIHLCTSHYHFFIMTTLLYIVSCISYY